MRSVVETRIMPSGITGGGTEEVISLKGSHVLATPAHFSEIRLKGLHAGNVVITDE